MQDMQNKIDTLKSQVSHNKSKIKSCDIQNKILYNQNIELRMKLRKEEEIAEQNETINNLRMNLINYQEFYIHYTVINEIEGKLLKKEKEIKNLQ